MAQAPRSSVADVDEISSPHASAVPVPATHGTSLGDGRRSTNHNQGKHGFQSLVRCTAPIELPCLRPREGLLDCLRHPSFGSSPSRPSQHRHPELTLRFKSFRPLKKGAGRSHPVLLARALPSEPCGPRGNDHPATWFGLANMMLIAARARPARPQWPRLA